MVLFILGVIVGVLVVINGVRIGMAAARYLWKHALGLLILSCMIAYSMTGGCQVRANPEESKYGPPSETNIQTDAQ